MRRRGGGGRQHLHEGIDLGAVRQVHVERAHLTGEAGAEVSQLFQIAAAWASTSVSAGAFCSSRSISARPTSLVAPVIK